MTGVWLFAIGCILPSQGPDSIVYTLSSTSRFEVHTGKAGLLGFAGHEHDIRARAFSGRIVYYPARPDASHLSLTVAAESLEVLTPPDSAEIRKVTESMRTDVLDVARFPEIGFVSRTVELRGDTLLMRAALTLKGETREIPIVVRISIGSDTLRAATSFTVKQTAFGIRPYRGGPAGTVRVADPVRFTVDAVAVRAGSP